MNRIGLNNGSTPSNLEISRLLTAAVINKKFCKMLLSDPAKALDKGYNGEAFRLATDDKEELTSIHAKSLVDFASQLTEIRTGYDGSRTRPFFESRMAFVPGMD